MSQFYKIFIIMSLMSLIFVNISDCKDKFRSRRDAPSGRIEIRALMMNCQPELYSSARKSSKENCKDAKSNDHPKFHGFDKDEIASHSIVKDCKRKLVITMRLNNAGKTVTEEQFVIVDYVYDPVINKRLRLLNPFVFKLKQNQVLQLYGLQFQKIVNGEVSEEVINKNQDNFTGCDTISSHPTCGLFQSKDHRKMPYSEGFCCSCDAQVNSQRQPPSNDMNVDNSRHCGPPAHVKAPWPRRFARDTLDHSRYSDSCYEANPTEHELSSMRMQDKSEEIEALNVQKEDGLFETRNNSHSLNINKSVRNIIDTSKVSVGKDSMIIPAHHLEETQMDAHQNNDLGVGENTSEKDNSNLNEALISSFQWPSKQKIEKDKNSSSFGCGNEANFSNPINRNQSKNLTAEVQSSNKMFVNNLDHYGYNRASCQTIVESITKIPSANHLYQTPSDAFGSDNHFLNVFTSTSSQDTASLSQLIEENMTFFNNQNEISSDHGNKNMTHNSSPVKRTPSNHFDFFSSNDDPHNVDKNSILNPHDDLKPVSIRSKLDMPFLHKNSVHISKSTQTLPISERWNSPIHLDSDFMEPAKGFKMSDHQRNHGHQAPWEIHTTECNYNRYNQKDTSTNNKYHHYLKLQDDLNTGALVKTENLKDILLSDRYMSKLAAIESSNNKDLNAFKPEPQKRNLSGGIITGDVNQENDIQTDNGMENKTASRSKKKNNEVKRQALPEGIQIRGGQSCVDRSAPANVNPVTYHESAHCLRFSELW